MTVFMKLWLYGRQEKFQIISYLIYNMESKFSYKLYLSETEINKNEEKMDFQRNQARVLISSRIFSRKASLVMETVLLSLVLMEMVLDSSSFSPMIIMYGTRSVY